VEYPAAIIVASAAIVTMSGQALGRIEFGGPDMPPRRLRDLLQAHVDASPSGSRIDWATYYFRDRALAEALIRASDRGVRVRLALEPDPRRKGANDAVIAMLKAHGLKGGFHLYNPAPFDRGHLHAKIYAFSQPNIAWVGSFNPSGDEPEDADVIAEIGDQDRGHNLLLGIERPRLTSALRVHVRKLARWRPLPLKFTPHFNLPVDDGGTRLYFYPRFRRQPAEREIARLKRGDRFRGAISHLKNGELTRQLEKAVKRGATVDLLVHDTERRVPCELVKRLSQSGVRITRVGHPDDLPMHAKFLLVDCGGESRAWLGSHNFNPKSQTRNAELLLCTADDNVISALSHRFDEIAAMA
jgi:phosphatidylserine/phosphatidylglycerophosphate/cardiolipin synthase-like enzyme